MDNLNTTTKTLTAQQIFDTVARHLLTQKVRSIDIETTCMYRGPNGTKCAAGALIPDDVYSFAMENLRISPVCKKFPKVKEIIGKNIDLVGNLQTIHDEILPDAWKIALEKVAINLSLDKSVLKEF